MANLLIAVGGTGQHVALACARLARIGAIPREDLECFILDSDDTNALAYKVRTFDGTVEDANASLRHPLQGAHKIHPPFARIKGKTLFSQLFVDEKSPGPEREVFELLFDDDAGGKDLNHGMFGRPAVGATVFAKSGGLEIEDLPGAIQRAERIIICGSFVGGTGAGITHQLVTWLKEGGAQNKPLFGVFLLPWLRLGGAAGGGDNTGDVDDIVLDTNMRHGVEYYFAHTAKVLFRSVLLGIPDGCPEWLSAAKVTLNQGDEVPHLLHLVAAHAVRAIPEDTKTDKPGQIHAYGHAEQDRSMLYDSTWGGKALRDKVYAAKFAINLLRFLTRPDTVREIQGAFKLFGKADAVTSPLYENIKSHKKICNLQTEAFIHQMIQTWATSSRQLSFSLQWITELIGDLPAHTVVSEAENQPLPLLRKCWTAPLTPNPDNPLGPEGVALRMETDLFSTFERGVQP
jgi:hypothetical protein